MRSAQQIVSKPAPSAPERASSVLMGRQDFLSVLLRLIGMELYKLRRRLMSKVLSAISILATMSIFGLITLVAFLMARNDNVPAVVIENFTQPLRLPSSFLLMVQLLLSLGPIVIIILVSTIVGGEYTSGTIRLMLTRGPTRTQILLSKIGAALACIVLGVVGITLLGILTGLLLNLTTGTATSFAFFNIEWLAHALLYLLITVLSLSVYAMMALCLSTLGRATAAGIAGVLIWIFLIEQVIRIIGSLGGGVTGTFGSFLQALPDYLIGTSISVLQQGQLQYLEPASSGLQQSAPSELHALLVLTFYLMISIGLAWWVSIRRDITN